MHMAKAHGAKTAPPITAILPAPRADVTIVHMREDRAPRRKQRGEIYSSDDKGPPPRKMLRVASEAKLADYLGPTLHATLAGIRAAYNRLTEGMGMGCASYEARHRPGPWTPYTNSAGRTDLADRWVEWGRTCDAERVNLSAVIDVVVMGHTPASIDRLHSKRNGWVMEQIRRAAELWLSPRVRLAQSRRMGAR